MCIRIVHVRFAQDRVAAAPGYLLLPKAVTSAISVVKADHVQGGACTKRDTEVFLWLLELLLTALFGK